MKIAIPMHHKVDDASAALYINDPKKKVACKNYFTPTHRFLNGLIV